MPGLPGIHREAIEQLREWGGEAPAVRMIDFFFRAEHGAHHSDPGGDEGMKRQIIDENLLLESITRCLNPGT